MRSITLFLDFGLNSELLASSILQTFRARNVCKIDDANSSEFKPKSKNKVIDLMESQRAIKLKGGTMRLGSYDCEISTGTKALVPVEISQS